MILALLYAKRANKEEHTPASQPAPVFLQALVEPEPLDGLAVVAREVLELRLELDYGEGVALREDGECGRDESPDLFCCCVR